MSGLDFSSTRKSGNKLRLPDSVLLLAGSLLFGLASYQASAAWAELRGVRRALDAERRQTASITARLRQQSGRADTASDTLVGQTLLTVEAPPEKVLSALAEVLPVDVRLDGIVLSYGSRLGVEMRVVARKAEAYDRFLTRLGESAWFEAVVPGTENREGEVRAQVQAVFRGGQAR